MSSSSSFSLFQKKKYDDTEEKKIESNKTQSVSKLNEIDVRTECESKSDRWLE